MIVYIYDNGFCDPLNNVGACRKFSNATDAEGFINFFIASMKHRLILLKRFRVFITDNTIDFAHMDHFILMNEGYQLEFRNVSIEEVNIKEVASQVNNSFIEIEKVRKKRKKDARKRSDDRVRSAV